MTKLLKLLSENSNFSISELAAMLGESEEAVKAQIKEYENKGIIRGYQAIINCDYLDDSFVEALIELKVTPKKETGFDEIAEMCMAFDEVESVYLMAGVYDLALIVQDIAMFVAKKLSTIEGVLSTGTHFIMRRYKDRGLNLTEFGSDKDERSLIL